MTRARDIMTTTGMIPAELLRQWLYCPRIVHFRVNQHVEAEKPFKVARGVAVHEKEARRFRLDRDGRGTETYFNTWLESPRLGLQAFLDCFEMDGGEAYPVEIKSGKAPPGEPFPHHKVQLVAQAMLLEEAFGMPVTRAVARYVDAKVEVPMTITHDDKAEVRAVLAAIRACLASGDIPDPTPHERKCGDCEYWQYCMRT